MMMRGGATHRLEEAGMSIHQFEGEHQGEKYVVRLREQDRQWLLDSLVIGLLPREFDGAPTTWPTLDDAVAASRTMAERFVESASLHSATDKVSGDVPLG
jgi:hypothetical protein